MINIDKQAKSVIRELIDDARSRRLGKLIITADEMEALLDELEAKDQRLNEILTPNMLLPVIDDMDEYNLRHVIKTVCENYSLLHAKWEAAEKRIAELEAREVKPVAWRLINSPESPLSVTDNKHIADVWKRNGREVQALCPASTVGLVPVGTALSEGRQMSAHNKSMVVDVMVESGKLMPGDKLYIAAAAGKGEAS